MAYSNLLSHQSRFLIVPKSVLEETKQRTLTKENIFFDNWESIGRTFSVGLLAYFSLIAMLRISGKRTLSQMKEFDFIVTVALGSTLATRLTK